MNPAWRDASKQKYNTFNTKKSSCSGIIYRFSDIKRCGYETEPRQRPSLLLSCLQQRSSVCIRTYFKVLLDISRNAAAKKQANKSFQALERKENRKMQTHNLSSTFIMSFQFPLSLIPALSCEINVARMTHASWRLYTETRFLYQVERALGGGSVYFLHDGVCEKFRAWCERIKKNKKKQTTVDFYCAERRG